MRDRLKKLAPPALAAATVAAFFGSLARPDGVLALRDLPRFHLPLRHAFQLAAREGMPLWNPWIHGGQPILSNPNYAAFYPPTWLIFLMPPHAAIHLLILLHALLGFAGAWRLARHLGCRAPAAAFTAVAFVGGGAFVSSAHSLTPFCGLAWMPWILYWGDRLLRPAGAGSRGRPLVLTAAALALQFLAGEPVIVLTTGLALLCLGLTRWRQAPGRLAALAAAAALAALLAAVQLLPTAARVLDSARAGGLAETVSTSWSTPPERLLEWVFPRFYGDPMRGDENLYFGWRVHDRNFPYLVAIYLGQPVVFLALAALLRWPVPRRRAWWAMILAGIFLALGRYNPLYPLLSAALPVLALLRFPEKFLLLSTTALAFAAGLGWQHLLDERAAGRPQAADFPAALAAVAAACSGVVFAALLARPDLAEWFIRQHTLLPPVTEDLAAAVGFLRREAVWALALALLAALVLLAHRARRAPATALAAATLALLATDLARFNRGLTPTVPASELLEPPPAWASLPEAPARLFTDALFSDAGEIVLRSPRQGPDALWNDVERLQPYLGNLWGSGYVLHQDYDLMLTGPARTALETLRRHWREPLLAQRLLAAWSVDALVLQRPLSELLEARRRGLVEPRARLVPSPARLPRLRFAPEVALHPDLEAARRAAHADGFRFDRREHWVDERSAGGALRRSAPDTRAWEISERGAVIGLRYRASAPTFLVAAHTFDRGWSARVDGRQAPVHLTAAGQIGVALPPGEHRLELRYRDLWVAAGAALGLVGTALALLLLRGRRAAPPPNRVEA